MDAASPSFSYDLLLQLQNARVEREPPRVGSYKYRLLAAVTGPSVPNICIGPESGTGGTADRCSTAALTGESVAHTAYQSAVGLPPVSPVYQCDPTDPSSAH